MSYRALFCGDRNWNDHETIHTQLKVLQSAHPNLEICHGACRGADVVAGIEAKKLGIPVTPFPAEWDRYGKAAGPIRNRQMLREFQPQIVMAFHRNLEGSRGTKDMITAAKEAGVAFVITGPVRKSPIGAGPTGETP